MKTKTNITLAAFFFLLFAFTRAEAQLSFTADRPGNARRHDELSQQRLRPGAQRGRNDRRDPRLPADNAEHAFLFVGGQMYDLNTLCDLSLSNFKVLTVAKTITDSCLIIGEGVTMNGEKHAFLLTPTPVDGGNWSYICCQVGLDPGRGRLVVGNGLPLLQVAWPARRSPPVRRNRPIAGGGRFPVRRDVGNCPPPPPPPDYCWTCINGHIVLLLTADVTGQGRQVLTVRLKRRRGIAESFAGSALTEKSCE